MNNLKKPLIININAQYGHASFFVMNNGRKTPVNIAENPPYQPFNEAEFSETNLVLKNIGITSIPKTICDFSRLEMLDLSENRLTRLPESFEKLTNLTHLGLNDNQFTSLPELFGELTKLQVLNLRGNQLTRLPESFGKLADLQALNLRGNQLTTLPESFGELSALRDLDLRGNQLTTLPESFGNLNLRTLYLDDTPILLEPIKDEYFFKSKKLLNTIKKRFNIDEYNELLELREKNWNERKSAAVFADSIKNYYATPKDTSTNAAEGVFFVPRFMKHVTGYLGEKKRDKNDVLKLRGGYTKRHKNLRKTMRKPYRQ
jgi:hypothetical protein